MSKHGNYQKLTKQWSALSQGIVGFDSAATGLGGSLAFDEAQTIIRVVGEYMVMATSAPAVFDAAHITFGLAVLSTDAVAAGAGSVPDPAAEPDYPWLWWAQHQLRFGSTDIQDRDGASFVRRSVDIRSMRKVKPRESLVWVYQYENGGGNPPLNVSNETCRVLVGIH